MKISIIGAGKVGCTTAYTLIIKNLASEILLVDIDDQKCEGEVRDLSDSIPLSETAKVKKGCLEEASQSDIAIITAGVAQKPGESRLNLLKKNNLIIQSIIKKMDPINPNIILLIVTNPMDIITNIVQQYSKLPKKQIFGTGTLLDSLRLRGYLSEKLSIAEQSINVFILGEHGDSQFAAWSCAEIAGKPIIEFPNIDLEKIEHKTKEEAYKIIECKGATYYGIASCVAEICENIIFNQKRVMPVSSYINKFKTCISVPAVISKKGIEKIIYPNLSIEETTKLEKSAEKLAAMSKKIGCGGWI